jgi:endo-1,4-beta-D-glucanase Y
MHNDEPRRALRSLSFASLTLVATVSACLRVDSPTPSETSANGGHSTSSRAGSTGSNSGGSQANSGGVSSSSTPSGPPMRGPEPATSAANFPFPQNRQTTRCVYPTNYLNGDVQTVYAKFKADLVTTNNANGHMKIQRTATDGQDTCRPLNSAVSEGIAYGMLIAAYMDDQTLFDNLWLYEQQHLDSSGLMNWAPDGSDPNMCGGGATDADEDMAFALVMASRQWPNQGMLSDTYLNIAIGQIQKIWATEIFNFKWLRAGDGTWATNVNQNISYFAPAYYRVFQAVDPKACAAGVDPAQAMNCDGWLSVIDQSYATIADSLNNGNASNGLVPGWCDDSHGPGSCGSSAGQPFNYQYDACRTPFRIGLDWCWFGETRAQSYVSKTSGFFAPIGASAIVDGYNLDGTPASGTKTGAAPFIGPAAVGAMSSGTYQTFLDGAYTLLAQDDSFQGGEYYASSWTVLSLLMMTGNFLDYTNQNPIH